MDQSDFSLPPRLLLLALGITLILLFQIGLNTSYHRAADRLVRLEKELRSESLEQHRLRSHLASQMSVDKLLAQNGAPNYRRATPALVRVVRFENAP